METAMEKRPIIINDGRTSIRGWELVPNKLCRIFDKILELHPDKPVWNIVLDWEEPIEDGVPVLSHFYLKSRTIALNLGFHFKRMNDVAMDGHPNRAVVWLWIELLISFYHELYHAREYHDCKEKRYFVGNCLEAQKWANKTMHELFLIYDMEPPNTLRDDSKLWVMMRDWEQDLGSCDETWARTQLGMAVGGKVCRIDEGIFINDLHNYFRIKAKNSKDPAWFQKLKELEPIKTRNYDTADPITKTTFDHIDKTMTEHNDSRTIELCELFPEDPLNPISEFKTEEDLLSEAILAAGNYGMGVDVGERGSSSSIIEQKAPARITTLPAAKPSTLNNEQIIAVCIAVFARINQHVWDKCEFKNGEFTNVGAVLTPISIADIPNNDIVVSMSTIDTLGHRVDMACNGQVKGTIIMEGKMPSYSLTINVKGVLVVREYIPQNPNKTKDGKLTPWAKEVREGKKQIAYVFKKEEKDVNKNKSLLFYGNPGALPTIKLNPFGVHERLIQW